MMSKLYIQITTVEIAIVTYNFRLRSSILKLRIYREMILNNFKNNFDRFSQ